MKHNLNIQIKNENFDSKLLSKIINEEFISSCEKILIEPQQKFIDDFFNKIFLSLKNYYSFNINSESKELNRLLFQNKINFIANIYTQMFKLCSSALHQYNSPNIKFEDNLNISYLLNYKPHCMLSNNASKNNNSIGTHICGGKYIIISKNTKKSEINNSYIICTKCNKCYLDICFPIICCNCNMLYYSEIISDEMKKENCYLATWYKYHCKNINNEKMTCIQCGDDFWIRNNKLFCKKCKFEIEPINIIWTCLICNTDFNSEAKVYNKYEFKLAELILKEALIYKKISKPSELPCKCFQNDIIKLKETNFFHNNLKCKGFLYYSEVNNRKYLVCSKCLNIYTVNKFKWTCPICFRLFYSSKIFIIINAQSNKNRNIKKNDGDNLAKNNSINSIKLNTKFKTRKNSPKKMEKNISMLNSDKKQISPNKINSQKNKSQNKMNRISSFYTPTISSIPTLKDICSLRNHKKIGRNILEIFANNNESKGDLYDIKNKKRNLSLLPQEIIKNDIYLTFFQNSKNSNNNNKLIRSTTSTIFSSNNKNNIIGKNISTDISPFNNRIDSLNKNNNQNNNNMDINNNENLIFKKKLNNEFKYKINNILISPKLPNKKKKNQRNNQNKSDIINNIDSTHKKNLNKKLNKSFNFRINNNILLNQDTNQNILTKENSINELRKIHISRSKNIFTINNSTLGLKHKIHNKSLNKIGNSRKNRNIITIRNNNFLNLSSSNKKILEYKQNRKNNNIKINFFNNITINNLSKPNISISNSKKKKNKSLERIKKFKVKNIKISLDSKKTKKYISHNLSFAENDMQKTKDIPQVKQLQKFNIDDYTIITQLGQGSFGKIYLAKDSQKNIYSIKKILLSEELDVKSVIAEYNMCYNFSHPNIINIMGIYSKQLDKTTYVVYVLMEVGISDWDKEINSLKNKNSYYSESELFSILKQVVSACSFLQKNNISHRDIKPQNILVFKNKIYKLIDFGEARRIGDKEKNNKELIQYSLKGTELYMSPLLFNGLRSGQIDVKHNVYKSDVYSLGLCMLYAAMCCDKALFEIRRIVDMEKIKSYINSALKENYNQKLINIIISMLEIHEQNRPDFIELEKKLENDI